MTWLNVLKHHRYKLGLLLLAANMAVWLNLAFGTPKAFSEWHWLDIVGEGGTALFMLFWLGLVLKSRPTGRVTNYLASGLCFMFFSWWLDVLDEFIRLPKHIGWDHWLESGPMPIGMILLTIGLFHWHREQQAINQHMEKRERVFREHRLFDKLTPWAAPNTSSARSATALRKALSSNNRCHFWRWISTILPRSISTTATPKVMPCFKPSANCSCSTCAATICSADWPATALSCCCPVRVKVRPGCWRWNCNRQFKAWPTKPASMVNGCICQPVRRW